MKIDIVYWFNSIHQCKKNPILFMINSDSEFKFYGRWGLYVSSVDERSSGSGHDDSPFSISQLVMPSFTSSHPKPNTIKPQQPVVSLFS
jgi:hypothetical protein